MILSLFEGHDYLGKKPLSVEIKEPIFVTAQLNGVQEFTEVVRKGSFVAAAEGLGVTRSALSKSIKRLEIRLGFAYSTAVREACR